jgi:hypothetical protein
MTLHGCKLHLNLIFLHTTQDNRMCVDFGWKIVQNLRIRIYSKRFLPKGSFVKSAPEFIDINSFGKSI